MRHPFACLLLAAALAHPVTAADPPADQPKDLPMPTYTTQVKGTVPDLIGRWLAVANVSLVQGGQRSSQLVSLSLRFEVTRCDGKQDLVVHWVDLPASQKQQVEAANSQATAWQPSEAQLREVRDSWDTLPPINPQTASVETTLTG